MKKGTVVKSIAGHDRGTFYIVIDTSGDMALVCDGKNKTLEKPKKKKLKHLRVNLILCLPII